MPDLRSCFYPVAQEAMAKTEVENAVRDRLEALLDGCKKEIQKTKLKLLEATTETEKTKLTIYLAGLSRLERFYSQAHAE